MSRTQKLLSFLQGLLTGTLVGGAIGYACGVHEICFDAFDHGPGIYSVLVGVAGAVLGFVLAIPISALFAYTALQRFRKFTIPAAILTIVICLVLAYVWNHFYSSAYFDAPDYCKYYPGESARCPR